MASGAARVLVVDDSAVYRRILSDVVGTLPDVELVGAAEGGAGALDVARRQGCDIVLLDLQMPGMDGLETLAALRKIDPKIAVVLMSGRATAASDAAVRAAELGVTDFIPKPDGTTVAENVAALSSALAPIVLAIRRRDDSAARPYATGPALAELRRRLTSVPPPGVGSGIGETLAASALSRSASNAAAALPRITLSERPGASRASARPGGGVASGPMAQVPRITAPPPRLTAPPPRITAPPPRPAMPPADPRAAARPAEATRPERTARAEGPAQARAVAPRGEGTLEPRRRAAPQRTALARGPRVFDLLVIATSTGGPEALMTLLPALPGGLTVPVAVVQHMPPVFTATLAARLDHESALAVREAEEGDLLAPGRVLLAPGGRHLRVAGRPGRLVARLDDGPRVNDVRPAADVLLRSVAELPGVSVLAVVLTGMGGDGTEGLRALGGERTYTLVQDEASSAVYGMPARVVDAGLADEILDLRRMAPRIAQLARARAVG